MDLLIAIALVAAAAGAWRSFDDWRDRRRERRLQEFVNRVVDQATANLDYAMAEDACREQAEKQAKRFDRVIPITSKQQKRAA